jgi:transcriptional regulator GlxA family with amidase domain
MPTIAQTALLRRLNDSGELRRLKEDFLLVTGLRLEFAPAPFSKPDHVIAETVGTGALGIGMIWCLKTDDSRKNEALRRVLRSLAEALIRKVIDSSASGRRNVLPAAVERAARILRKRFQEPLRLSEVALEIGISRERLSRLFHSTLGITFTDYLNRVRLEHCRELLRNPEARIADVAFESGFQSLSQFNRRFKATEGISPSRYQRRLSGA